MNIPFRALLRGLAFGTVAAAATTAAFLLAIFPVCFISGLPVPGWDVLRSIGAFVYLIFVIVFVGAVSDPAYWKHQQGNK